MSGKSTANKTITINGRPWKLVEVGHFERLMKCRDCSYVSYPPRYPFDHICRMCGSVQKEIKAGRWLTYAPVRTFTQWVWAVLTTRLFETQRIAEFKEDSPTFCQKKTAETYETCEGLER